MPAEAQWRSLSQCHLKGRRCPKEQHNQQQEETPEPPGSFQIHHSINDERPVVERHHRTRGIIAPDEDNEHSVSEH